MRGLLIATLTLCLAGCGGLKLQCDNADEVSLGHHYATHHIDKRNFETFKNQCAKYGYRVPSSEKFLESYAKQEFAICNTSHDYFMTAYQAYRSGGGPLNCSDSSPLGKQAEEVRSDAFRASLYREKLNGEHKGTIGSRSSDLAGAVLLAVIAAPFIAWDIYDTIRSKKGLETVAEKYGYMPSELN